MSFQVPFLRWKMSRWTHQRTTTYVCTRVARWFVFKPKVPVLGKFGRVLQWKILVDFMTIWSMLLLLEIFYGHFVYFVFIWYILPRFWYFEPRKIWQPWYVHKQLRFVHNLFDQPWSGSSSGAFVILQKTFYICQNADHNIRPSYLLATENEEMRGWKRRL
jgi:hypothetical protein